MDVAVLRGVRKLAQGRLWTPLVSVSNYVRSKNCTNSYSRTAKMKEKKENKQGQSYSQKDLIKNERTVRKCLSIPIYSPTPGASILPLIMIVADTSIVAVALQLWLFCLVNRYSSKGQKCRKMHPKLCQNPAQVSMIPNCVLASR